LVQSKDISLSDFITKIFTKTDIRLIAKSCEKIRAVNTKKNESRQEYIKQYENYYDIYHKLVENVEKLIEELKEKLEEAKVSIRENVIQEIRKKQEELGITSYLLNPVKYSFIKTIVNWLNNPTELKKKSIYRPRAKNNKQKLILKKPEFNIDILEIKQENTFWKVYFQVVNKSNYPLQNLDLKFFDKSDEQIYVTSAAGNFVEVAKGLVHIPFVPAPMSKEEKSVKYVFTASETEELNDVIKVKISFDFPPQSEILTKKMLFES
jgi:hypothetical protein